MSAIEELSNAIQVLIENVRSERGIIGSGIRDNEETRQALDDLTGRWAQVVAERDRLQAIISGEFPEGCTPADARMLRKANHGLADENDKLRARVAELEAALQGMLDIVADSRGVAGYHLNGDTAEWDEFDEVDAAEKLLNQLEADNG